MPIPDKESYWFMDCMDWREQETVMFGQLYEHLTQNWGPDDHFEVLNKHELGFAQQFWHKSHENAKKANEVFFLQLSCSCHRTTNFPNSESWICTTKFCLLAWSTVGQDTLQFLYWNHATFSNSF